MCALGIKSDRAPAVEEFGATGIIQFQSRIWNEFAHKFGYDDVASNFLARVKAEEGLVHRTDIITTVDLIDLRERRGERSDGASASPESPPPVRRPEQRAI